MPDQGQPLLPNPNQARAMHSHAQSCEKATMHTHVFIFPRRYPAEFTQANGCGDLHDFFDASVSFAGTVAQGMVRF